MNFTVEENTGLENVFLNLFVLWYLMYVAELSNMHRIRDSVSINKMY